MVMPGRESNGGGGRTPASRRDVDSIVAEVISKIAEFTEAAAKIETFMTEVDAVRAKAVVAIGEERDNAVAVAEKEIRLKQGEAVADIQDKKAGAVKAVLIEKGDALTAIKNAKDSAVRAVVSAQLGYSLSMADSPENAKPEDQGHMNSEPIP